MKKGVIKILLFSLALMPLQIALGQQSIRGSVIDASDFGAIVGATVFIPDLKIGALTDTAGMYTINDLPKGRFLVEVKYIGFANFVKAIEVNGQTILDIRLEHAVTELNEVVVTGMSHSSELRNNPLPILTINQKDLAENVATNLIDNIARKPGISQITTGPAISKPLIRGLGYTRIITLHDGIRQEGQQWGDEHGIEIDEYAIDRVEIIKGAGSLMYGSDGLGGVLNFLSPNPVSPGAIVGKWSSEFQSNNGMLGNSLMAAGNQKRIYWLVRGTNKIARSYRNAFDGKVFNSGFREADFNGMIGINRSWGYSQVNITSFHQDIGVVEGTRDSLGRFTREAAILNSAQTITASDHDLGSYNLFAPRQEIEHFRVSSATNIYFGASRLQLNAGVQRNQRMEFGDVLNDRLKNLYFDLHTLHYNLTYFFPEKNGWQLSSGTSGMWQQNTNKGVEFLIPEYHSADWGVFLFTRKHFEKVDLSAGVRGDQRQIHIDPLYLDAKGVPTNSPISIQKFSGGQLSFSGYSASLGITVPLNPALICKLNFSRGFRAPNISELSSNGHHEGSLRYEYGNQQLNAETSFQMDAGIMVNTKHVSAELSLFQNDIQHYIFTQKLKARDGGDSIPDLSSPVPAYRFVAGHAQLIGAELFVDVHPHPLDWLHFENGFSFVNGTNLSAHGSDSTKYLPFIPAPRFQSQLMGRFNHFGGFLKNVFLKVEWNHTWAQDRFLLENHTETATAGYSLWNAGCGTDVIRHNGIGLFSILLTVNNLFDVAYQNNLSRLKYADINQSSGRIGVYNMGRNISIKVIVPLNFRKL